MNWVVRLLKSSLGSKYIMAITGAGLFLFVLGHIAGNYLLFQGADAMNAYAVQLRHLPFGLLWVARIGLIVVTAAHLYYAFRLTFHNKRARPERYQYEKTFKASFASRTMIYSGSLVLLFILFHLAHFTFRWVATDAPYLDAQGRDDVYRMVIESFQDPTLATLYVISMLILGFHLSHGLSSMFQSLGLNHRKYNQIFRQLFPLLGWAITLAAAVLPIAVQIGFIK